MIDELRLLWTDCWCNDPAQRRLARRYARALVALVLLPFALWFVWSAR